MIAYLYELLVAPMVPEMWLFALIVPVFFLSGFIKGTVGMGQPGHSNRLVWFCLCRCIKRRFLRSCQESSQTLPKAHGADTFASQSNGYAIFISPMFWQSGSVQKILTSGHNTAVKMTLGVLLLIYAANGLMKPLPTLSAQTERRWATPMGAINGFFVGITAATPFPGVPYLYALGMPREQLIQSMGIMFPVARHGFNLVALATRNSELHRFAFLSDCNCSFAVGFASRSQKCACA